MVDRPGAVARLTPTGKSTRTPFDVATPSVVERKVEQVWTFPSEIVDVRLERISKRLVGRVVDRGFWKVPRKRVQGRTVEQIVGGLFPRILENC